MGTEVAIPGGTAVLRDGLVTERQRRIIQATALASAGVMAKMQATGGEKHPDETDEEFGARTLKALEAVTLTPQEAMALLSLQDAGVVAFLESWTLDRPLPTLDTVQTLPPEIFGPLAEACRPKIMGATATDFSPTPEMDQAVPTGGSGSSGGGSTASPESNPTPQPSSSGESTATGASTPA